MKKFAFVLLAAIAAGCGSGSDQGDVIFYTGTDNGCGNIRVEIDGFYKGQITRVLLDEPDCSSTGGVRATLEPGNHALHAVCDDGTAWNTNFRIERNGCLVYELR